MPERIYKLQPDRTLHLRGFDGFGAAAALHSATKDSFKVSGVFRDAADFAVLVLYDADNFYDHPSIRYLPDFDFNGLTLSFDVHYSGLMTIDSPNYPTIDWPRLDYATEDGKSDYYCALSDHKTLVGGTYTKAEGRFTVINNGMLQGDKLQLWYLNNVFEYEVPSRVSCSYQFFASGADTLHTVTVNGQLFSYTEQPGDNSAVIALRLCQALKSNPDVFAAVGDGTSEEYGPAYQLNLWPKLDDGSSTVTVSSSVYPTPMVLGAIGPATVAQGLAKQINEFGWAESNVSMPLEAECDGPVITIRHQQAGVDGNSITMYATASSERLTVTENWVRFANGISDMTWHVEIPFDARSIRQLWLTFAPALPWGEEMQATEWEATFTNWQLTGGTEDQRRLVAAGPGSVRIDDDDSRCEFSPAWSPATADKPESGWSPEAGFYSRGFARCSKEKGETVTVSYQCDSVHDIYLGTSLYSDRGGLGVEVDGAFVQDMNLAREYSTAVNTRRKIASSIPAGRHKLKLTHTDSKPVYFDFFEAVVASDVPDALTPRTNVSPALDYSTDHTFKLSPQRLLWNFDKLGFAGPMNEYVGVFWWNQRVRTGGNIPAVHVHFDGTFSPNDQVFLEFGPEQKVPEDPKPQSVGKTVLLASETPSTIARHFEAFINGTMVGVWANADGPDLTITARSTAAAYSYPFRTKVESSTGTASVEGNLMDGESPDWDIDPSISPVLNRGARDWHSDFFKECATRNRPLVVAESMELVHPPDDFKARYHNETFPQTGVQFAGHWSFHCAFNAPMLAYQKRVLTEIATLMNDAGLTPSLQLGEFCWWYFPLPEGGMAFYDSYTRDAARAALEHELFEFQGPDQDPSVAPADALFLRNRLRDHVAALAAEVRGKYPNARIEVLFPYDVNYPKVVGIHALGGRLLRYLNFPAEWEHKQTSGLDTLKMEGLDFGAWTRNLDLATDVMRFPLDLGWPVDSVRYLVPVFKSGAPWDTEYRLAKSLGIPVINFWAFDHFSLFALDVLQGENTGRAVRV